jgi:acetyltransferase-like isoleucine patch superfamily enzyme
VSSDECDERDGDDEHSGSAARVDRLSRHPTEGPGNSMVGWAEIRSPARIVLTYVLVVIARLAPSLRVKRWALRRAGVTVGRGVSWGLEATPDVFWPELITLEDDCIVGYDAVLLCHEFLQSEYRTGEVVIGERAMVGAKAVVLPGVRVGADAQVAAGSLVAEDVPAGETWAGVPAEPVARDGDGGTDDDEGAADEGAD